MELARIFYIDLPWRDREARVDTALKLEVFLGQYVLTHTTVVRLHCSPYSFILRGLLVMISMKYLG